MTGIHLIVPLEDDTDSSTGSSHRMNQVTGAPAAASVAIPNGNVNVKDKKAESSSGVLSDELREQFETMKAVWRQTKRANSVDEDIQDGNLPCQEELKRKERETAVETALAVDEEISRWKNGIAELEAMLAAEEDSSVGSNISEDDSMEEHQEGVQGQQRAGVVRMHHRHRSAQQPPQPHLGFPDLPPVVPNEEDDEIDGPSGP